ncbi:MAG: NAD(P)-dependent dehydrogenase (short-subunit alcohol dehydrogenase family) [Pseudohongiellaceae bacterium]|jgi:NAD(P)-dependent dehydrogenase (short-subunit alcohol dehydrogenase family)
MNHKIALITGAGTGIGRAVALALGEKHYHLVLAGRRIETLEETAALLAGNDIKVSCVVADVCSTSSVDALFKSIHKDFGRLDLLFNNAGIGIGASIESLASDDWLKVMDTNVNGAFYCLQGAFRMMKEQDPMGGRIINNGSISAESPRPNSIAYTASKHAVLGMTKSTSLEGRPWNIACGQIDIGNATTDMGAAVSRGAQQADGSLKNEPLMDVKHVGEAVVYMDSLPLESNVQFMTVMATKMPFIGRG